MRIIKFLIKKYIFREFDQLTFYPTERKERGRALVSYIIDPLTWDENDDRLKGHSNGWECREIVKILQQLGYIVDVFDYFKKINVKHSYDVVFDIHQNLQSVAPFLKKDAKKILYITGSYPRFQNAAELVRVDAVEKRKNKLYSPKRLATNSALFDRSFKIADLCALIGNDYVKSTFPLEYANKITLVPVSGSYLSYKKEKTEYAVGREFLWFFGRGVVHKGLDLVLDVFAQRPDLTLHIVGPVNEEKDFLSIYNRELNHLYNIKNHGFLLPSSEPFIDIIKNVCGFIAPSCSEGTSTSVVTCLQLGLYPIISRQTGVTLPEGCGIYLEECSLAEIEQAVDTVKNMNNDDLIEQIATIQTYACREFSRKSFSHAMTEFLSKNLSNSLDNANYE